MVRTVSIIRYFTGGHVRIQGVRVQTPTKYVQILCYEITMRLKRFQYNCRHFLHHVVNVMRLLLSYVIYRSTV